MRRSKRVTSQVCVVAVGASDWHQGKSDQTWPSPSFDLHDAFADLQFIQERFLVSAEEECASCRDDVFLMLQSEINLRVAIPEDIDGNQRRMLGDADQAFAKRSDFSENIFQAVGGLMLNLTAGE